MALLIAVAYFLILSIGVSFFLRKKVKSGSAAGNGGFRTGSIRKRAHVFPVAEFGGFGGFGIVVGNDIRRRFRSSFPSLVRSLVSPAGCQDIPGRNG